MARQKSKPVVEADLKIRNATLDDIPHIQKLVKEAYPHMPPYKEGHLRGQIQAYPKGCFVCEIKKEIVGYCASFIISKEIALSDHSWAEVTGGGYNSRHDPKGDLLYGMEVCVSPRFQGRSIGTRLYDQRKKLVTESGLDGIVIVGRIPGYHKHKNIHNTPRAYVRAVRDKKIKDRVLNFQLAQGFVVKKVMRDYLRTDIESEGHAVLLFWKNPRKHDVLPDEDPSITEPYPRSVRIATVNYQQRRVKNFEEFLHIVEYFVDIGSNYSCDFITFPEWFTLQLLSTEKKIIKDPLEGIKKVAEYTDRFKDEMRKLALRYNINIIGGTAAVLNPKTGGIRNDAFVFLRDGAVYQQPKLHPTPNEKYWWNLEGGEHLQAIPTDCGLIGVLICYDSEFPEVVRHLVDQGMKILFVPFCTDERQSYLRVRYCGQARAIENQIYVVLSGNVGNLPRVENMDIQYAQSCILTPCDFPFARDGIAADTTPNVETVAVAELRLDDLIRARNEGTVQNLKDRRHDLYQLVWKEKV